MEVPNTGRQLATAQPGAARRIRWRRGWPCALWLAGLCCIFWCRPAQAQIVIESTATISGVIESVGKGEITVRDANDKVSSVRVREPGEDAIVLKDGRRLLFESTISVTGNLPVNEIQVGQTIRLQAQVNRLGRTQGEIKDLQLLTDEVGMAGVTVLEDVNEPAAFALCKVVGRVKKITETQIILVVPPSTLTKKTVLQFRYQEDATATLDSNDYRRAAAGAQVTKLDFAKLNTGDLVCRHLEVEVSGGTQGADDPDDKLLAKYRALSDVPPTEPRLIRSPHFRFLSDLSDREARIVLDKLETMFGLLTKYFGRGPTAPVEGYIVRDLSRWPDGVLVEAEGVRKIQNNEGICFNSSLGSARRAILYACDDHGVIQHECTHGFCHLAFGSTGPTWLAEGVAELGNHWKAGSLAVHASPSIIGYLKQATPKRKLLEIAIPGRTPAGTWRDYAWRWALCHLLAYNPNYADRFKPLAIALMRGQENVSFEAVYGPVAKRIAFEYDLFLQHVDQGYRSDLTAWQWKVKAAKLSAKQIVKSKVKADYGWQATQVFLEKGVSYDVAGVGEWQVAATGELVNADGQTDGRGKLIGAIFHDFQLSEPIEFGKRHTFTAEADGQLVLWCRDAWNEIADNRGAITVHVRRTPE